LAQQSDKDLFACLRVDHDRLLKRAGETIPKGELIKAWIDTGAQCP
jgi:hypothetical protein